MLEVRCDKLVDLDAQALVSATDRERSLHIAGGTRQGSHKREFP